MGQRKPSSEWTSTDQNYSSTLSALCRDEDVLVVPEFVTVFGKESSGIRSSVKSRDSRDLDKDDTLGEEKELDAPRPPQVIIFHGTPDEGEYPSGVLCKNIYVEFSLVQAIGKSLAHFPTVETLKIEDCCISKDLAEALAVILSENPGTQISHLSLDGNLGLAMVAPLYLTLPTSLKVLSLQRCGFGDDDVRPLSRALSRNDETKQTLLILNLGLNKIGNDGARYLAEALRTNRCLVSLSLMGNQIGDEGAAFLADVLRKFELTDEEISLRRRRIFNYIFKRSALLEKVSEEEKEKEKETDRENSKANAKGRERASVVTRKIRGPDGKLCLSSRDKRGKTGALKSERIGDRLGSKVHRYYDVEDSRVNAEKKLAPTPLPPLVPASNPLTRHRDFEAEPLPVDVHPFVNESFGNAGKVWCNGCWSLVSLNLAYNNLSELAARKFTEAVLDQSETLEAPREGIVRLRITPGNFFKEGCSELEKLRNALVQKRVRREMAVASGSAASTVPSSRFHKP